MRLTLAGSLVTHLVCNTIKIASARYLARQEKLPTLLAYAILGIFSVQYFSISV